MKWGLQLASLLIVSMALFGCGTGGAPSGRAQHNTAGQTGHNPGAHGHGGAQPYAGLEKREIKALAPERTADLLAGRGAQYALAAELNHYPGPTHVLELATELKLTSEQEEKVKALVEPHKEKAKELGKRLVELERELDKLFASKQAGEAEVDRVLSEIGKVEAQLRGEHLKTHLTTTRLLTAEQVAAYDKARGYTGN